MLAGVQVASREAMIVRVRAVSSAVASESSWPLAHGFMLCRKGDAARRPGMHSKECRWGEEVGRGGAVLTGGDEVEEGGAMASKRGSSSFSWTSWFGVAVLGKSSSSVSNSSSSSAMTEIGEAVVGS